MRFLVAVIVASICMAGFVLGASLLLSPPDGRGEVRVLNVTLAEPADAGAALDWPGNDGPALLALIENAERGNRHALLSLEKLYGNDRETSLFMAAYWDRAVTVIRTGIQTDPEFEKLIKGDCDTLRASHRVCDIVNPPVIYY